MTLNLWILKDWLSEFSPTANLKRAKQEITGPRLYRPGIFEEKHVLYVATSHDFFHDGCSNIICKNQDEYLRLDTEDLFEVFNRIQDAFHFYTQWYGQCAQSIASGCSLADLVRYSEQIFSVPMIIVNAAQIMVAHSRDLTGVVAPEDMDSVTEHQSLPSEKLKQFNRLFNDSFYMSEVYSIPAGVFPTKSYCKHLFLNEERLGTVILKAPQEDLTSGILSLMNTFTSLIEKWIKTNEENAFAFRLTSFFVRTLDGHPGTMPVLLRQLSLFGWEYNCRKQVFVLCATSGSLHFDMRLIRTLSEKSLGVYMIPYKDQVVILCNLDMLEQSDFHDRLQELTLSNGYSGASSFTFTALEHFYNSYQQAVTALDHSSREQGKIYRCQDVAMRIIAKIVTDHTSAALLHPAVSAIREHDQQYNTDYYQTLFCFLKNERRHTQTAQELFIHRNTLFLRLEKIQELWSLSLEDADERFYLLFSFYQFLYAGKKNENISSGTL